MFDLFTGVLEPDDSDDTVDQHVNVDGSATRRLSNSRSALGATLSTWALSDHMITIIHRHVIVWIFYFYCGPSLSVIGFPEGLIK